MYTCGGAADVDSTGLTDMIALVCADAAAVLRHLVDMVALAWLLLLLRLASLIDMMTNVLALKLLLLSFVDICWLQWQ